MSDNLSPTAPQAGDARAKEVADLSARLAKLERSLAALEAGCASCGEMAKASKTFACCVVVMTVVTCAFIGGTFFYLQAATVGDKQIIAGCVDKGIK
ncbi:MAG: hypothetical protein ABW189_06755 [Rickettsiales bacterium]